MQLCNTSGERNCGDAALKNIGPGEIQSNFGALQQHGEQHGGEEWGDEVLQQHREWVGRMWLSKRIGEGKWVDVALLQNRGERER